MRSTSVPPGAAASSQLNSAVRAPPMCRAPVGDGANLRRIGARSAGGAGRERATDHKIARHANRSARLTGGRSAQGGRARGASAAAARSRSSTSRPRMWRPTVYREEDVAAFREALAASPIDAVLIHAVYLLNCASEDPDIRAKSLHLADPLAARGGSRSGPAVSSCTPARRRPGDVGEAIARAGATIREALAESEGCPLHLENTAGAGGTLGRSVGGARRADRRRRARRAARGVPGLLPPVRLRAMTSAPPRAWTSCWRRSPREIGLERVGSLHLNDSQGAARLEPRPSRQRRPGRARASGAARPSSPPLPSRTCRACSRPPGRRRRHRRRGGRAGDGAAQAGPAGATQARTGTRRGRSSSGRPPRLCYATQRRRLRRSEGRGEHLLELGVQGGRGRDAVGLAEAQATRAPVRGVHLEHHLRGAGEVCRSRA